MKKYCINATPKSGTDSNGACILAFDAENLKPSYHDNVVILGCNKFSIDEANSSKNWRDAFNFNEEPPQSVLITVSPGYKSGKVMPYFE